MKKLIVLSLICFSVFTVQAQKKTTHGKMMMKDCVMMEDGKMMQTKGGKTMDLSSDLTLKNGTVVMTDGTVKTKGGKTTTLKDGDCVYMNGQIVHKSMKKETMKKTGTKKTR